MSQIHHSPYPTPAIPLSLSLPQLLLSQNPDDVPPSKIILQDDWTGVHLTYSSLRTDSAKAAFGLREWGVREGDVVGVCGGNSVDVVRLIHAVLWCGGVVALINPLSTQHEISHYLSISQPQFLAADTNTYPTLSAAVKRQGITGMKCIALHGSAAVMKGEDIISFEKILDQENTLPPFDLSNKDNREHTAVVCFSSGTSGKAKGVELSHHNLLATMLSLRATDSVFWNAGVRNVFFAPMCHVYGLVSVVLQCAYLGFYTMLQRTFTLSRFLELSHDTHSTTLRILPTIAQALTKQTFFPLSSLKSVKYILCSGAVLPPAVIGILHAALPGVRIVQAYGMTEASITTLKSESGGRVGSVGKLLAGMEARIVDEAGEDVGKGKSGEMWVRGASVFRRYMGDEEATRGNFDEDGWMKTGDVLRVDEEGYWYMVERLKELVKYNGYQVPPAELEAHLNSHPMVSEGAVCALWDEELGTEVPIAYVALTQEAKASKQNREEMLKSIRRHVDDKVASYKKLRGGVVVLDEIPKSGNNKVLRRLLPARLARERNGKL